MPAIFQLKPCHPTRHVLQCEFIQQESWMPGKSSSDPLPAQLISEFEQAVGC